MTPWFGQGGETVNILVVYKKNFEQVHDDGLLDLKEVIQRIGPDPVSYTHLTLPTICSV